MANAQPGLSKLGFTKTFVLPALWVFLIPAITLAFFLHAQARYDADVRSSWQRQIQNDSSLSAEERAHAMKLSEVPMSKLLLRPQFAGSVNSSVRWDFAVFRWMIRLAIASLVAGAAVFVLGGLCVYFSLRSQEAQYWSLSLGWHVLRIYSALQVIAQGAMVVALSYWVTALWMNFYSLKLVGAAAVIAVCAVGYLLYSIFKRTEDRFEVSGTLVARDKAGALWAELSRLCEVVETPPPDQIIAGIDDNFFVTEHPVTVDGHVYKGRTLFISLALLKQLERGEAAAVLAHEMAHFSGADTTFSRKISPLLGRYGHYLAALQQGGVTLPIYYFMLCFRALFEASLGKLSREREFRADGVAVQATSPQSMAGALLRIAAYSEYRGSIEKGLFERDQAIERVEIGQQVERGFAGFASAFASRNDLGGIATAHPFDTHPPIAERFNAIGVPLGDEAAKSLLAAPGDGGWFQLIDGAADLEREQWSKYEEQFQKFHHEMLAYRYLPETAEEQAVVEKYFPQLDLEGKAGTFRVTHRGMQYAEWPGEVLFADVEEMSLKDNVLRVRHGAEGKQSAAIKLGKFGKRGQEIVDIMNRYYGRHMTARVYIAEKQAERAAAEGAQAADGA